jgi:NAD(P)-dependent dehydrogenase (short-subunit alcohol dehydrogenase family)
MVDSQHNNLNDMETAKEFILITGASSGIGRCLAKNLSMDYHLILIGRDEQKLETTKLECCKDNQQLILKFDLTHVDEIESTISGFISKSGIEISYFVHCAGLMKMIPVKMVSLETINAIFATNVISASLIVKVLLQRKVNKSALRSVVFISSNISNFGAKAFSIYAASKGALDSLMRCLAVELSPMVRVNSVLPGAVQTEMTQDIFNNHEARERMAQSYPLGFGKPEDIYDAVNFLISEKSRWITGQQLTVDGGRTINISG